MKIEAKLIGVNKNDEQDATIMFTCSLEDLQKIQTMVGDFNITFYIEDAGPKDKITGRVAGATVSASGKYPYKFKIKTPASENVATSELSTLCSMTLNLIVEVEG